MENKNTNLEWIYGQIEMDKTEMNNMINSYLNSFIEPSYQHLYYEDHFKGRIWYDYKTITQCIQNKREELNEKQWRLNNLEYLMIKNSFPEKYKAFLFNLLTNKDGKFYEIMNKECDYYFSYRQTNLWNVNNSNINVDHCALIQYGPVMCKNCKYYLDVIKEYKEIINNKKQ